MGMEGVELVMKVEDRFAIRIDDCEATRTRTVGELCQLVLAKIGRVSNGRCLSASVFRDVRKGMMDLGLSRRSIRLKTRLDELVPWWRRRAFFRNLARSTGMVMPPLERARAVTLASILVVIVGAAGISLWLANAGEGLLMTILLWWAAALITRPLKVHPADCQTVAELARAVVARNYKTLGEKYQATTNDHEVQLAVYSIIAEVLGVRDSDLKPEMRFIEDLNM